MSHKRRILSIIVAFLLISATFNEHEVSAVTKAEDATKTVNSMKTVNFTNTKDSTKVLTASKEVEIVSLSEEYFDIASGDIYINANSSGTIVKQGAGPEIKVEFPIITGSTNLSTVIINAEDGATADVIFSELSIKIPEENESAAVTTNGAGNVIIELDGINKLESGCRRAGIDKCNSGSLLIKDDNSVKGELTVIGGRGGGAGIGGGAGASANDIIINGGIIHAQGSSAAGLGGGSDGDGANLVINNGIIYAHGNSGSGIGGGPGGNGIGITINGGNIHAQGNSGAGIGGGSDGDGRDITINNGDIISTSLDSGAGIGGGSGGNGINIEINGGEINASSLDSGAGIGGGDYSFKGGDGIGIAINGGNISVNGNTLGACIGGGLGGDGVGITINNGLINADAVGYGAGIGGGKAEKHNDGILHGNCNNITFSGGEIYVKSLGNNGGAPAIGPGFGKNVSCSNIHITGGIVFATRRYRGTSIGSGEESDYANVIISGSAEVHATGLIKYNAKNLNPNGKIISYTENTEMEEIFKIYK